MKPPLPPDPCLSVPGEENKGVRGPQAKSVLGVSPATSEAFPSNVPYFSLGRGYISERQTAAEDGSNEKLACPVFPDVAVLYVLSYLTGCKG